MPQADPEVRVVIPAFRAHATIRDSICAIGRAAKGLAHEIVVVDDGGNDDLPGALAGLPVTVLRTMVGGSAARARNLGASGFTGQLLVFIDADVIIAPDCLDRLLAPLRGGLAEASVGNYTTDTSGLGFGASYKQIYIARIYARRAGHIENDFWTAIGAVTAAAFRAVGGFDGSFAGANGEDAQFGRGLSCIGGRIFAVPDALGQHRHPLTVRKVVVNDWRKGGLAMRQGLRGRAGRLSDNRHATARDMLAVLLVLGVVAASGLSLVLLTATPLLAGPLLIAAYLFTRADLACCFAARGVWFAVRAVPFMALLDLVRAGCVADGLLRTLAERGTGFGTRATLLRWSGLRPQRAPDIILLRKP